MTIRSIKATTSTQAINAALLTIAAAATGAKKLRIVVDGTAVDHTTVGAQGAIAAATAFAATIDAALPASYVVTDNGDGTISIVRGSTATEPNQIHVRALSTDATQTIVADCQQEGRKLLDGADAAGEGAPAAGDLGYDIAGHEKPDGSCALLLTARLNNASAGTADASWRLAAYDPVSGWIDDAEFGSRPLPQAAANGTWTQDEVPIRLHGKTACGPHRPDQCQLRLERYPARGAMSDPLAVFCREARAIELAQRYGLTQEPRALGNGLFVVLVPCDSGERGALSMADARARAAEIVARRRAQVRQ